MIRSGTMLAVAAGALLAGSGAAAHADPEGYSVGYGWTEPRLSTGIGVGVTVGGGITGFTDQTMRNTMSSQVNGMWDVRATFGTHIPLALEVGYLGQAADVRTLAGTPNGTLVGTTVEADLRFNLMPHRPVTPYVFAGMGWQNYELTSATQTTADSGMRSSDNDLEFPMGVGLGFRGRGGLTVDVRGTFRATPDSTLVQDPRTGDFASAHWWEASAAIGYEF